MTIQSVRVFGPAGEYGEIESYTIEDDIPAVGPVTDIRERSQSPEPYCYHTFIEVWCGEHLHAEFPKQNVAAIYHKVPD